MTIVRFAFHETVLTSVNTNSMIKTVLHVNVGNRNFEWNFVNQIFSKCKIKQLQTNQIFTYCCSSSGSDTVMLSAISFSTGATVFIRRLEINSPIEVWKSEIFRWCSVPILS